MVKIAGDKIELIKSSMIKLMPIIDKKIKVYVEVASGVIDSIKGKNKVIQDNANNKVLIIGTLTEAKMTPSLRCFFFNHWNKNPANNPAKPVFNKQTKMVIQTLKDKNKAVDGASNTITPLTRPNIKPAKGPKTKAPITMGINDKVILTLPIVM